MSDAWHETRTHWAALRTLVQKRIGEDGVICIPTTTTSDIAPRLGVESNLAGFKRPTLCLMSIAGVAGLRQVTSPLAQVESCPVGLSLVGPPGSDEQLIDLASHLDPSRR
jgi:amidase